MPPRASKDALQFHLSEVDAPVPAAVQKQLATILHQRELLESAMAETDMNVYELETSYLGLCVELGGSLFDGFGLERSSLVHAGSSAGSGSPRSGARLGLTPSSPTAGLDTARGFPSSPLTDETSLSRMAGSGPGSAAPVIGGLASNILSSNLAFRARVHAFSPAERVFSSSSVGAIGRVERLRAAGRTGVYGGQGPSSSSHMSRAAAGGAASSSALQLPTGHGKSLWTSTGRRRSARAVNGGSDHGDDEDDDMSARGVHAVLYTTAGRRKRARRASDDDEEGTGSRGGGKLHRGAGRRGVTRS